MTSWSRGWIFRFQGKLRVTDSAALTEKYNALLTGACKNNNSEPYRFQTQKLRKEGTE